MRGLILAAFFVVCVAAVFADGFAPVATSNGVLYVAATNGPTMLTNIPPAQLGAAWKTSTVVTAVWTNDAGVVTGATEAAIIYIGAP
jgi:hypothetical protein